MFSSNIIYLTVQIGQSKYLNDFVIERVSKEDSGTYTCIAENIVASINTTVKVFVKGRY